MASEMMWRYFQVIVLTVILFGLGAPNCFAIDNSSSSGKTISSRELSRVGRPANFYKGKVSKSLKCNEILEALNQAHKPVRRRKDSPVIHESDLFLQSKLSIEWQKFWEAPWHGATETDLNGDGRREWVVKEVSIWRPRYHEALYWLRSGIDPTRLRPPALWRAMFGPNDSNRFFPFDWPKSSSYRDIPVYIWEIIHIGQQTFVLSMAIRDDPSPQVLTVKVLTPIDRRTAGELCEFSTEKKVSGLSF